MTVKTCIITGFGINSDRDLAGAFETAGSETQLIHINDLISSPERLNDFQILGFPGGFSFGDHLGSGLVFANLFKKNLKMSLEKFIADGKLIIGICNGFQVLVKMGVLPNLSGSWTPEVTLVHNECGTFIDDWVKLEKKKGSACVWLEGIDEIELPIRHGEGRFIAAGDGIMETIKRENLDVLKYSGWNPNGSAENIAGITDKTGRILGLMPHPEAFVEAENHPLWSRKKIDHGFGLDIIKNGVDYFKK
ncbi:MAG: phosphoribosylformylglycinamidine synthase subunit PurQ [Spirochaetales bacterium]|nr:phosphoribosylformylglycinamidine synthase subunit PurQ [Spirochaetales bacterium]